MWLIHECVSNQLCGFSGSGTVSTKNTWMQLMTWLKKMWLFFIDIHGKGESLYH